VLGGSLAPRDPPEGEDAERAAQGRGRRL